MPTSVLSPVQAPTFAEFRASFVNHIKTNLPQIVVFALIGAAISWVVNVYWIAKRYMGTDVPDGAPVTTSGNMFWGLAFWVVGSTLIFGCAAHWRSVGTTQFFTDVRNFPQTVIEIARSDGRMVWVHLLWGVAVALVLTQVLSPSLRGVFGVSMLVTIPSIVGRIGLGYASRLWSMAAAKIDPSKGLRQVPLVSPAVAGLGAGAAMILGFLIDSSTTEIVLAFAAAGGAIFLQQQGKQGGGGVDRPAMMLLFLFVLIGLSALSASNSAVADDGGYAECGSSWQQWWEECDGAGQVRSDAGRGAAAGALGGVIGGALGPALAGAIPSGGGGTGGGAPQPNNQPPTGGNSGSGDGGTSTIEWENGDGTSTRVHTDPHGNETRTHVGPDGRPLSQTVNGQPQGSSPPPPEPPAAEPAAAPDADDGDDGEQPGWWPEPETEAPPADPPVAEPEPDGDDDGSEAPGWWPEPESESPPAEPPAAEPEPDAPEQEPDGDDDGSEAPGWWPEPEPEAPAEAGSEPESEAEPGPEAAEPEPAPEQEQEPDRESEPAAEEGPPAEPEPEPEPEPDKDDGAEADPTFGDPVPLGTQAGGSSENPHTEHSGSDSSPANSTCTIGLPLFEVSTASRHLALTDLVASFSGNGPAIEFRMAHSSGATRTTMLGPGWSCSLDWRVVTGEQTVMWTGGGKAIVLVDGATTAVDSGRFRAERTGAGWTVTNETAEIVRTFTPHPTTPGEFLLAAAADVFGNQTTYDRDGRGRLERVNDDVGRSLQLIHRDADGNDSDYCTGFEMPDGRRASISYADGRVAAVVDMAGYETAYRYDTLGRIDRIAVSHGGGTTDIRYADSSSFEVAEFESATGEVTRFERLDAETVRSSDPAGRWTTYTSSEGRTTSITTAAGPLMVQEFTDGQPTALDIAGRRSLSAEHDADGRIVRESDSDGGRIDFGHDEAGRLTSVTDELGGSLRIVHGDQRIDIELGDGTTSSSVFDDHGRLVEQTTSSGETIRVEYDRFGNPLQVTDSDGTRRYEWDRHGLHMLGIEAPEGTIRYAYDKNDRVRGWTLPTGLSVDREFAATALRRESTSLGTSSRYRFDPLTRVESVTDALGNTSSVEVDGTGLIVRIIEADGRIAALTHDSTGRLLTIDEAGRGIRRFEWSAVGHVLAQTTPDGSATRFEHDLDGNISQIVWPDGSETRYQQRPVTGGSEIIRPSGARIVTEVTSDGTRVLVDGRATSTMLAQPGGFEISDAAGVRRIEVDDGRARCLIGDVVAWAVDRRELRFTRHRVNGADIERRLDRTLTREKVVWPGGWIDVVAAADGLPASLHRSNGVDTEMRYDAVRNLAEMEHTGSRPGDDSILDRYEWDAVGRMVSRRRTSTLELADLAAPVDTGCTFGPGGRLRTVDGERVGYDFDGNVTSIGSSFRAGYDAIGRMQFVEIGDTRRDLVYDGFGRLARITSGTATRSYLHDDTGLLLSTDEPDGSVITFVHSITGPVVMIRDGVDEHLHWDRSGTLIATSSADGSMSASQGARTFGEVGFDTGLARSPLGFHGRLGVLDLGGGLYAMGERIYFAALGRFLQPDPLGLGAGPNPYEFVEGDPLAFADPSGNARRNSFADIMESLNENYLGPAFKGFGRMMERNLGDGSAAQRYSRKQVDALGNPMRKVNEELGNAGTSRGGTLDPVAASAAARKNLTAFVNTVIDGAAGPAAQALARARDMFEGLYDPNLRRDAERILKAAEEQLQVPKGSIPDRVRGLGSHGNSVEKNAGRAADWLEACQANQ